MPKREHHYVIVRVLGVDEFGISIALPDRPGAAPRTDNLGAMNMEPDAVDVDGNPVRATPIGMITVVDTDLIY